MSGRTLRGMGLENYGVLSGTFKSSARDTPDNQGRWFHVKVFVDVDGVEYLCAVDVDSKMSATGVEWRVRELDPSDWTAELALAPGFHALSRRPTSGALDYARSGRIAGTDWTQGSAADAATALEKELASAKRVLVFGAAFTDHGNGMHDIHQNQGDPAGTQWWDQNETFQDGATILERQDGTLVAFLNKFTSQSRATDGDGHAPYHPPKPAPKEQPLQALWDHSVASLVARPYPDAGDAVKERHRIYCLLLEALVVAYWNGNKRGREGEYPWREKQRSPNGGYRGGDYNGHNIACIAVDANGDIIDFDFNHNDLFQSSVEHAESRLVRRIFSLTRVMEGWNTSELPPAGAANYAKQLAGVSVYTSLESCAQCSGIMALGSVKEVVFLQRDPGQASIGNILRNLIPENGSFSPPNPIPADAFGVACFERLAQEFAAFGAGVGAKPFFKGPDGFVDRSASITSFLCTDAARDAFIAGADAFEAMELGFPDHRPDDGNGHPLPRGRTNAEALAHARAFLAYAIGRGHRGTPHKL